RIGLDRSEVVDRYDFDGVLFTALIMGTKDVAADAAVTVDGDFDGHALSPDTLQRRKPIGTVARSAVPHRVGRSTSRRSHHAVVTRFAAPTTAWTVHPNCLTPAAAGA